MTTYTAPYNPATNIADVQRAALAALPSPPDASGFQTGNLFAVTYQAGLTANQQSAFTAAVANAAADPNAPWNVSNTLQARAVAALTANATFLTFASPSNVQTVAQVQTLTKECSAIIRLLLGQLDTTAGT